MKIKVRFDSEQIYIKVEPEEGKKLDRERAVLVAKHLLDKCLDMNTVRPTSSQEQ